MNRKIIYVDFSFKRKKITSKPLLFIYKIKINIKRILNNLFAINTKTNNTLKNIKSYPFKKVL